MGWEEQSRVRRLGDRHELQCLPGLWFRPQKYSVQGSEAIQIAQLKLKGRLRRSTVRKLVQKYREGDGEKTPQQIMSALGEEELEELLEDANNFEEGDQSRYKELVLLHGIGEHNFTGEDGAPEVIGEPFVSRICRDAELTEEMVAVIEEWNRPLASASAGRSTTSPSGSSGVPSSRKGRSSRTETGPGS